MPKKEQRLDDDRWTVLKNEESERAYVSSDPLERGLIQAEASVIDHDGIWTTVVEYTRFPRP
jgi:hypothetical protein